jgi:hypothetical protein
MLVFSPKAKKRKRRKKKQYEAEQEEAQHLVGAQGKLGKEWMSLPYALRVQLWHQRQVAQTVEPASWFRFLGADIVCSTFPT